MFKSRSIAKSFVSPTRGFGALVNRPTNLAESGGLDPFIGIDEFVVGLPGGFTDHPHRGFETVTYVLPSSQGNLRHEDFMGNKGELRPGDLQWMTPGRGIMHAEMPATTDKCHGLQLWVNLPKEKKLMAPRYQEIQREQVPHAFNDDKSVEAIVFAGEAFGKSGPIQTEAPVTYVHFILQPGAKLEYALPASHNVFVYGISGSGLFGDKSIEPHEAFIMSRDGDGVALSAAPCRQPLELIVISGQPLEEPVFQYGPFVMSSQEEIQSTLRDFELCTNGFEAAEGWRSEIARRW